MNASVLSVPSSVASGSFPAGREMLLSGFHRGTVVLHTSQEAQTDIRNDSGMHSVTVYRP